MAMGIMNWNIQYGGNDANGGGFKQGGTGTDRSLQDSPHVTLDGSTIKATSAGATANMTITGHTAAAADVGNIVHITTGVTNATAGWYEIQSISGSDWVVDRNWCTGAVTAGAGRMGGALATPGGLGAVLASATECRILYSRGWIKYNATAYTLGSATYNIATGAFQHDGTWNFPFSLSGYETTQGDTPTTRPTIASGTYNPSTGIIYSNEGDDELGLYVSNLIIDGNAGTASVGIGGNVGTTVAHNVKVTGCDTSFSSLLSCSACESDASSVYGLSAVAVSYKCSVHNGANGVGNGGAHFKTITYDNSGIGFLSGCRCYGCQSVNNAGDGFDKASTNLVVAIDCISTNNAYGFHLNGNLQMCINCWTDENSSGGAVVTGCNYAATPAATAAGTHGFTELTASPWVNVLTAADDYWLNNDNPGGAQLRKVGTKLPLDGVVDEPDIGATQHADPAGGGGGGPLIGGRLVQ